jgi:capsular exopolysaccharide synthesis family protein
VVPLLKDSETVQQAIDNPSSHMAEAHHTICLGLESVSRTPNHPVLLLTSSCPTEGKSTTALKLGVHFAEAGKRVLLIDGDMRRGSLHRLLGCSNKVGLANVLSNAKRIQLLSAIQYCERYGFAFLSRGRSSANPAGLLASDRFAQLLEEISAQYDIAIIDGPPVLGLADAPRLAGLTDATLFVLEANRTSKQHARSALRRLSEAGAGQIGMILTKYDPSKDLHDYGYAYCYDYGGDFSDDFDEFDDQAQQVEAEASQSERAKDEESFAVSA